jgi:hypothetical protein
VVLNGYSFSNPAFERVNMRSIFKVLGILGKETSTTQLCNEFETNYVLSTMWCLVYKVTKVIFCFFLFYMNLY